jgi:MoaA/NifB/PqqE/SkfB family radical SAM enzyme
MNPGSMAPTCGFGRGEPVLHPQPTELLVYAKNLGCKIGLITNG